MLAKRDSMVVGFDLCPAKRLALPSHDEATLAQKGDATYDHKTRNEAKFPATYFLSAPTWESKDCKISKLGEPHCKKNRANLGIAQKGGGGLKPLPKLFVAVLQ